MTVASTQVTPHIADVAWGGLLVPELPSPLQLRSRPVSSKKRSIVEHMIGAHVMSILLVPSQVFSIGFHLGIAARTSLPPPF
jgi:hypothetical protein